MPSRLTSIASEIPDWEIDPSRVEEESLISVQPKRTNDTHGIGDDGVTVGSKSAPPVQEIQVETSDNNGGEEEEIDHRAEARKKRRREEILAQAKKWTRELEGTRDALYHTSLQNVITLDFLAMQGLDEKVDEHDLASRAMAMDDGGES